MHDGDSTASERSRPRVLICEDEGIVATDIGMTLRDLGYLVVGTVPSAERAVEVALAKRPDLVLMDVHTKGTIDGVEAARIIRDRLQVPVVFLTAHGDPETVLRARSADPLGYVVKPFKDIDLRSAIEVALQRDATERRLRERERLLALEKERLSTLIANLSVGVLLEDEHGDVRHANAQLAPLLGQGDLALDALPLPSVLRILAARLHEPDAAERSLHVLWRGRARGQAIVQSATGRTIEVDYAPIGGDSYAGALWTFSDVSERERARAQLRTQAAQMRDLATADELTALLNRRGLLALGPMQQQVAARERRQLLTAYIALHDAKGVNDELGQGERDALRRAAAVVLRDTFRASDAIARVGHDDFAVLAMVSSADWSASISERLRRRLVAYNELRGEGAELRLSVGFDVSDPAELESIDALLARAGRAMSAQRQANQLPRAPE